VTLFSKYPSCQGWTDEELPENILAVIRIHNLHLNLAEEINFDKEPLVKANGWTDSDPELSLIATPIALMAPRLIENDHISTASSPLQSLVDLINNADLSAGGAGSSVACDVKSGSVPASPLSKTDLLPCPSEMLVPVENAGSDEDDDDVFEDAEDDS
jgi:hypothetical protein